MNIVGSGVRKVAAKLDPDRRWTVAEVDRDVMAGPVSADYWRGEVSELAEAIREGSWAHVKEEWGDVTLLLQLMLHGKGVPGVGKIPVTELTGKNSLRKFIARLSVWERIYEHHNRPFNVRHLIGGGNYAKEKKVRAALAHAGVTGADVDLQWLKKQGIVTEP